MTNRDTADDIGVRGPQPIAVPRQLPPPSATFTNREQELAKLSQSILNDRRDARSALVVLSGSGGVGKTTLAAQWLGEHAALFPGGVLHADLGGFGAGGPTSPAEILGRFLRALGVSPEHVPADLAELVALYRSMTSGKPVAVLADDADSAAQVRPLLPAAPGSVVVVTSRWRLGALAFEGATVIAVDVLANAAGTELLRRQVGPDRVNDEPELLEQLAELCDGLPIALCVAAARLTTRPRWSVSRMVRLITDEQQRLSGLAVAGDAVVEACFDLSYKELAAATARMYRLLGLFPGSEFGVELAAAAAAVSPDAAEDAMDELVDANLLLEVEADRFRFHDLLRLHARNVATAEEPGAERDLAVRRMVEWLLDRAVAADSTVLPLRLRVGPRYADSPEPPSVFADRREALDWLERELPNLVAVTRATADQDWPELTWQICEALWSLFLFRRNYEPWRATHQLGIDAARRCGDLRAQARLHIQLGYAELNLDAHQAAAGHFTSALDLGQQLHDLATQMTASEHLGLVALAGQDPGAALPHFEAALALARELDRPRAIALHLRRVGETRRRLGHTGEAAEQLRQAVAAAADVGDDLLRGRALTSLGLAHADAGRPHDAEATLREAAGLLELMGADHHQAEALEALADLHTATGNRRLAYEYLDRAATLFERSPGPRAARTRAEAEKLRPAE